MSIGLGSLNMAGGYLGDKWIKEMWMGNSQVYLASNPPLGNCLCFTSTGTNGAVRLSRTNIYRQPNLEYSLDNGETWNTFLADTTVINFSASGEKCYIRGDNDTFSTSNYQYYHFVSTGSVAVSGNIMSLLSKSMQNKQLAPYMFFRLFSGNSFLTGMVDLPATKLNNNCYDGMFKQCLSITTLPSLPADTLAPFCYHEMFAGCTSLLNNNNNYVLPAMHLARGCYAYMFANCTSIITAPQLPALQLATECYMGMFYNDSILSSEVHLHGRTLMEDCYKFIFYKCSSLRKISVEFTEWIDNATNNWVYGVASGGSFYKPTGLTILYGNDYIPDGWSLSGGMPSVAITFDNASDIDYFTLVNTGATMYSNIANGTWTWGWTKTDSGGYYYRSYDQLKGLLVRVKMTSRTSYLTPHIEYILNNGDALIIYIDHYANGWASYLPFPSYTNHSLVVYRHNGVSEVKHATSYVGAGIYANWEVSVRTNHILVSRNDVELVSISSDANSISRVNFKTADGWWQTQYRSVYDYMIEYYDTYNYGDGSLNTVSKAYNDKLLVNNIPYRYQYIGTQGSYGNSTNISFTTTYAHGINYDSINTPSGNYMAATMETIYGEIRAAALGSSTGRMDWLFPPDGAYNLTHNSGTKINVNSGTNNFTFINPITPESTVTLFFGAGGLTTYVSMSDLRFIVNGSAYTLQDMVENGMIKPLVLLGSQAWSSSYVWNSALNLYSGGSTGSGNFPGVFMFFMSNATITGITFSTNKSWNATYDGWYGYAIPTANLRFTLSE